jgi:hypothetical protein
MLELQVAASFTAPMSAVFAALVRTLAEGRWFAPGIYEDAIAVLPRGGLKYSSRRDGYTCNGEVLECLRPVSVVLHESLLRARSSVDCRQRWRVEPMDDTTRVCGEIRASLSRIAALQKRQWQARLMAQSNRVCEDLRIDLAREFSALPPHSGAIGQSIGKASIVSKNRTTVSGKPIFR